MERNLVMYSGTNLPELNDKVFEGFESNLGIYYTAIRYNGVVKDLCNDNVVKVNFKPGDKVWYTYGGFIKGFNCLTMYRIEKCLLDEDMQKVKIEGVDGMYPANFFTLRRSVFFNEGVLSDLDEFSDDEIITALDKLESRYEKKNSSFESITKEMNELYEVKNANYGNSFSKQFEEYGLVSSCIRLEDKLNRLKSLNKASSNGTKDESVRDTLIDLANYAVLTIMELDKGNKDEDKING